MGSRIVVRDPFSSPAAESEVLMNCSVAIQYLPMNAVSDEETCRIVDEVIACIDASGLPYSVGPFETTIEGSFDACMKVLYECQLAGARSGCEHSMVYAKINYRPNGEVVSTEHKIGKYHDADDVVEAFDAA